jgi:hypothetical protein
MHRGGWFHVSFCIYFLDGASQFERAHACCDHWPAIGCWGDTLQLNWFVNKSDQPQNLPAILNYAIKYIFLFFAQCFRQIPTRERFHHVRYGLAYNVHVLL